MRYGDTDAPSMNGVRYREKLTEFLWPNLDGINLQDSTTPHFAN